LKVGRLALRITLGNKKKLFGLSGFRDVNIFRGILKTLPVFLNICFNTDGGGAKIRILAIFDASSLPYICMVLSLKFLVDFSQDSSHSAAVTVGAVES